MQKHIKVFTILLCFTLLFPLFAWAIDVQISGMKVTDAADNLLLSLKVEGAFNEKLEEAILNGIPATFSFFINVNRKRTLWADEQIVELNVTHTLKYHNLKNHYIIKKSREDNKPVITESFDEAKKIMSEINGLKIVPLNRLRKGSRYQIMAKAELDKVKLPFLLNYILFFASLWDFETEWHSHEFVY
ncbi:MAG: DUF4390 domain-containing protein [Desulfobacteraceae bacterium]|nr:DUF4390 domain-containing protein [Desulfobacteraceae bacterium]MBC2755087.1 DUF4390 domain-containing protein [Desulfobacteraceae bacterium]